MKAEGLSEAAIAAFKRNYDALTQGVTVRAISTKYTVVPARHILQAKCTLLTASQTNALRTTVGARC